MRLPGSEVSGVSEFRAVLPIDDRGEDGTGIPRSNNVGCGCALASYFAEATMEQTVAVSPIWAAASSGLRGSAVTEKAHDPSLAARDVRGISQSATDICLTAGA
jgi:hypothetical protein